MYTALNLEAFSEVKYRLECLLNNRQSLENFDADRQAYCDRKIYIGLEDKKKFEFSFGLGVCTNADLWALDHNFDMKGDDKLNYFEMMHYSTDESVTFMDKLGITFCLEVSKNFDEDGRPRSISPIVRNKSKKMWQNEMRWKYVEFCLEKVNHVLKTKTNPF